MKTPEEIYADWHSNKRLWGVKSLIILAVQEAVEEVSNLFDHTFMEVYDSAPDKFRKEFKDYLK